MKIKLYNFKCHLDSEFEFPDTGLILLNGESGGGKSTILKAIQYAFFGTKAIKKPYSFGKTTCSVELHYKGLKIIRTNKPNRLIVNDLEDDAAQYLINEMLNCDYDVFMISSFIPQKNNTSILSLPQTEQLRMIKTLAFDAEKNEKYKQKIKEMINSSSKELLKIQTEYSFIDKQLTELNNSMVYVDAQNIDCGIEEFQLRLKNYDSQIMKIRSIINDTTQQIDQFSKNIEILGIHNSTYQSLTTALNNLETEKSSIEINILDKESLNKCRKECQDFESRIENLQKFQRKESLKTQIDTLRIAESSQMKERIAEINSEIWDTGIFNQQKKELDLKRQDLLKYKQYERSIEQMTRLKINSTNKAESVEKYTNLLEHEKQKRESLRLKEQILVCPCCDVKLVFVESQLQKFTGDETIPIESIEDITQNIKNYTLILQKLASIQQDTDIPEKIDENNVNNLEESINVQSQLRFELNKLMKSEDSIAIKQLTRQYDSIKCNPSTDDTQELMTQLLKLKEQINTQQNFIDKLANTESEINNVENKIKKLKTQITTLELQNTGIDIDKLHSNIIQYSEQLTELSDAKESDKIIEPKVLEYLVSLKKQEQMNEWIEKLDGCQKLLTDTEERHTANQILKKLFTNAEILTMETTINNINGNTKYYLDEFFTEPIQSLITTSEDCQKIQTIINYKGNEYDSIHSMSGGELDRISLASVCGINNMVSSPILMLDESLSSLDSDLNTDIIRFLEELSKDKLIIICSHECVQGVFHKIINL